MFDAVPVRISVEDGAEKVSIELALDAMGGQAAQPAAKPSKAERQATADKRKGGGAERHKKKKARRR